MKVQRKTFTLILLLIFSSAVWAVQRPKIGLVLSGGGAKGLAHIGLLQAIDSAGLKIDYITGTSMGSIVGGFYAAGYSGNEIARVAKNIKWDEILALKTSLPYVSIEEKEEFNRYSMELALENKKLSVSTGILEGQELSLLFSELFLPVYNIKDFSKLSIPFKCVATDVSSGKPVILDSGELTTAIRASMAIPTVFTAVDHQDTKLVDGGVVKNFPVSEVKSMGADFIIGSSVISGLLKANELRSGFEVLYQIAMFKDADVFESQKQLCNIYIHPPLNQFSVASFMSSDSIMSVGKQDGLKYYPVFKHLADSLNALYPIDVKRNRLPALDSIIIDQINIVGLKNTTENFFKGKLNLAIGKYYTAHQISNAIRNVYGTTYYKTITYSLSENKNKNHAIVNFNVSENPTMYVKQSLHYNTFSEIAVILAVNKRNLIFDKSNTTLKLNLGKNIRLNASYHQFINNSNTSALQFSVYHENVKLPVYIDFKESQQFRNSFSSASFDLLRYFNRTAKIGAGITYESNSLIPKLSTTVQYNVRNSSLNAHAFVYANTLNRSDFPQSGWKINCSFDYVFNQHPDNNYYLLAADLINITNRTVLLKDYQRLSLKAEKYIALSPRFTLMQKYQGNTNIFNHAYSINQYFVGGLNDFMRNQSTFAGLSESEIFTTSIASAQVGLQAEPVKNFFLIAQANAGTYDFMTTTGPDFKKGKFISGYAFSIGYLTPLFPVQASIIYSDQTKSFGGCLNFGFAF